MYVGVDGYNISSIWTLKKISFIRYNMKGVMLVKVTLNMILLVPPFYGYKRYSIIFSTVTQTVSILYLLYYYVVKKTPTKIKHQNNCTHFSIIIGFSSFAIILSCHM